MAGPERTNKKPRVLLAVAAPVAMVVAYWATRDALFLASFDVLWLPRVLGVSALFGLWIALPVARLVGRIGPQSVLRLALIVGAALCLVLWWLEPRSPRVTAFALYVMSDVLASTLAAVHGVLLTERIGVRQLQNRLPTLLGAVALGAGVGGGLAEIVATRGDASMMLPLLAFFQVLVVVGIRSRLEGSRSHPAEAGAGSAAATSPAADGQATPPVRTPAVVPLLRTALRTPYLRTLGAVIFVASACAIPFDYALKASVGARSTDATELLRFFGAFYVATALVGFLMQGLLGRLALERLGLAGTLSAVPLGLLVGGASVLLVPALGGVAFARGLELTARRALFRPAYALLYTPVPQASRPALRTLIEIAVERVGEGVCGGVIFALAVLVPGFGMRSLALVALALALVAFAAVRRLQSAYLEALEQSLAGRAIQLDRDTVQDRTTRKLVESLRRADLQSAWHESSLAIPVGELRRLLAEQAATPGAATSPSPAQGSAPTGNSVERVTEPEAPPVAGSRAASAGPPVPPGTASGELREFLRPPSLLRPDAPQVAALTSDDPEQARRVLEDPQPLDRSLVPYVIPLLARDDLATAAVEAMRRIAPHVTGMLVDVLHDPEEPVAVRRRIPRILAVVASPRVTEGLLRGLEDARSEVRLQCGRALARLHVAHPELPFERERVMNLVLTEARRGKRVWESQQILEVADEREDSPLVDEVLRDRANRSLEHVFTLLSLVLPLEPLRIAFAGLHTDDPVLRNTALEYLDTVLPPDVRSSLWPLLAERGTTPSEPQPAQEALADLIGSNQSIQINLAELRRRSEQGP